MTKRPTSHRPPLSLQEETEGPAEKRRFYKVAFCLGLSFDPSYLIVLAKNEDEASKIIKYLHTTTIPHTDPPEKTRVFISGIEDLGFETHLVNLWIQINRNEYLKAWMPDKSTSKVLLDLKTLNPDTYNSLVNATENLILMVSKDRRKPVLKGLPYRRPHSIKPDHDINPIT